MGNVCCCQEEKPQASNNPIKARPQSPSKPKEQSSLLIETQKNILHDFFQAVRYLKQNGKTENNNKFTGFQLKQKTSCDDISSTYSGAIIDEQNINFQCVIKEINKQKLASSDEYKRSVGIEYLVTKYLGYPFVQSCLHFHEDQEHIYLIFDLRSYRPLSAFVSKDQSSELSQYFKEGDFEQKLRFVIAGIVLGLEKLHSLGVVYRAVNLDNVVITENGYPQLTNLSRLHPESKGDASPAACHFTSPEEFRGEPVTRATDCWALGVLIYFLAKGTFINYSTFKQKQFKAECASQKLQDLVNQLLIFKAEDRLGSKGLSVVKRHKFFIGFEWQRYEEMQMESPLASWKQKCKRQTAGQIKENQTGNFYSLQNQGLSMLGLSLCMDLVTVGVLTKVLESESTKEQPNLFQEEQPYEPDQHQLATEIDIAAEGEDYD